MVCKVITADKANRLYWLGRYAERVYISLHLLRRYYDKVIDGDIANFDEYYKCLNIGKSNSEMDGEQLQHSQLYDHDNIFSIASSLDAAKDNGIVLRRDITSESLAYIEMSRVVLDECRSINEKNITHLQLITDYVLAFFGSIDERVFNDSIRNFLKLGRLIENIDLRTRFHYPFLRIEELFLSLKEAVKSTGAVIDTEAMEQLQELITEERYKPEDDVYRLLLLGCLNRIVMV